MIRPCARHRWRFIILLLYYYFIIIFCFLKGMSGAGGLVVHGGTNAYDLAVCFWRHEYVGSAAASVAWGCMH